MNVNLCLDKPYIIIIIIIRFIHLDSDMMAVNKYPPSFFPVLS